MSTDAFSGLLATGPERRIFKRRANRFWLPALFVSLPAGRDIFIHGEPNQPTKPVSYYKTRDWTNGCVALSNEDLQDVWNLTVGQTRVEIVP
jgi:hypothetical protein